MLIDTVLFYVFALLTLGGAVLTITRRNAVHSAISLIVSLLGVAGLYLLQHAEFLFAVQGIEIEGQVWEGVDVQFPWEPTARRHHRRRMQMKAFHIDRHPVTNAQYKAFMDATGYAPQDAQHFLRDWREGAPQPGWENKPVTWVSLEDARAYAAWAGKRLPHGWEWQYAAQGTDGRLYPWGDAWRDDAAPPMFAARPDTASARTNSTITTGTSPGAVRPARRNCHKASHATKPANSVTANDAMATS